MGRLSILGLGLPEQLPPRRDDLSRPGDHIGHLKAHAGPGAIPLAATMDTDNAASNFNIGHGRILTNDLPAEDRGVEGDGAGRVRCPDDVFEPFDVHN